MMSPERILVGGVSGEEMAKNLDNGEGILFRKLKREIFLEERANAILVVLGPEQSPREVAETILWALR